MTARFVACALALAAGTAHAAPTMTLTWETDGAIHADVRDVPKLAEGNLSLRADTGWSTPSIELVASEPIAIAVAVSGSVLWLGNDKVDDADRAGLQPTPGAFDAAKHALGDGTLREAGPEGSTSAVVTYATDAAIKLPVGPLASLDGVVLGLQRDYARNLRENLVAGITTALDLLKPQAMKRKLLLVLGDGADMVDPERAHALLPELVQRAAKEGVTIKAVIWRHESSRPDLLSVVVPDAIRVKQPDELKEAVISIVDHLPYAYRAIFATKRLAQDGRTHRFELRDGAATMASAELALPAPAAAVAAAPTAAGTPPWIWAVVAGGVLVVLIAVAFAVRYSSRSRHG